jgi:parvulin-like peptidyl-prolyl isomerase
VPDTADARRALLTELIDRKRQVIQAQRKGLATDPAVIYQQESILIAHLKEKLETERGPLELPTEEEVQAYYNENIEEFRVPARARVAWLVSPDRQQLELAKAKLASLPDGTRHFGELAIEYSAHQPTRYRGGDLGYIAQGLAPNPLGHPSLTEAAFALESPGEISEILETPEGFYLLRLIEKSPETLLPYSRASNQIRRDLIAQRRHARDQAIAHAAQEDIPAEINEELLTSLQLPTSTNSEPGTSPPSIAPPPAAQEQ